MEKRYGWLYKFAWAFEFAAALTGLAMAAVFNAPSYLRYSEDGIDATEMTYLLGGSLPFIMVAFAELCKIPLVTATVLAKTRFTKILFGLTTFAAAFITFETVYNGLEQTQAQRSAHIFEFNAEIDNLDNRIGTLENRISVAKEKSSAEVSEEISAQIDQAKSAFETQKRIIDDEASKIEKEYSDREESLLEPLNAQLAQLQDDEDKKASNQTNQIELAQESLLLAQKSLSGYEAKLEKCGAFSGSCKKINREAIANEKKKIKTLERKISRLAKQRPSNSVKAQKILDQIQETRLELQADKDKKLAEINDKRAKAEQSLNKSLAAIEEEAAKKKKTLEENENKVAASEDDKDALLIQIDDLKKEKALAVNANLVYRLAGRWFGVKAGDVTEAQAAVIGRVWSGSIAAIVAIMGPMIAGAYLVLNLPMPAQPKSVWRALAKAIRARKRRPKVIEKMVEVEKIVEKEVIVEKIVEKEIEKPVIKYVPIFTDDPTLVELSKDWKKDA